MIVASTTYVMVLGKCQFCIFFVWERTHFPSIVSKYNLKVGAQSKLCNSSSKWFWYASINKSSIWSESNLSIKATCSCWKKTYYEILRCTQCNVHPWTFTLSWGLSTDTGKTFEPRLCNVTFQHSRDWIRKSSWFGPMVLTKAPLYPPGPDWGL